MEAIKSIYHPDNTDSATFIASFTIRTKEFADIMDTIRKQKSKPLQHFLILGKRGMGKSTLLRRIFLEANQPPVSNKLVVVRLGTEQYRLSRLYKLWEEVIRYLSFREPFLENKRQAMSGEKHYEESIIHIILDHLKEQNKTLLLLIDNFDTLIHKLTSKEQHTLREILIQYPVQIIGTTVFYDEPFFQYDKPFYDFFKPVRLKNLDKDEAGKFISNLALREGIPHFEETFAAQRGKIQTLRILSGGVPRTLVILVSILSKKSTGDAVDYLREVLEEVTALYQSRMSALSSQQQEIMHHLAIRWDRTPVKDLARDMRLPSKSISAQLAQLESAGYINKIATSNRNLLYEIDERFFNIWLLMSEAAPYDAKRVVWLTRWLDMFYDIKELEDYATWCNTNLKTARPANRFLLAQALSESGKLSYKTKDQIVIETAKELSSILSEVKEWTAAYEKKREIDVNRLVKEAMKFIEGKDYENALTKLELLKQIDQRDAFAGIGFVHLLKADYKTAEENYLIAAELGDPHSMENLGFIYVTINKDYDKAEKYYLMAIENENTEVMFNLALLYHDVKKDYDKAEKYYLMAVKREDTHAMNNLGILYEDEIKDYIKAEKYFLLAVKKGDSDAMFNLGRFYHQVKEDYNKAEKFYLMAIEEGNTDALNNLGSLYANKKKNYKKAEEYYQMAIEHKDLKAPNNLALLYLDTNNTHKKDEALKLIKQIQDYPTEAINIFTKIQVLLWNEQFKDAYAFIETILTTNLKNEDSADAISFSLTYFLIFKQKQFLYRTFHGEHTTLIDRFKPVYYALLSEMKDEHPDQYLRMPGELTEPVSDLLSFINAERERLSL